MTGAGMEPPSRVSIWLGFYPTGEIPWLLKFFKELDELISLKLVPGRKPLIFPAQSSLWHPSANSLLANLSASKHNKLQSPTKASHACMYVCVYVYVYIHSFIHSRVDPKI